MQFLTSGWAKSRKVMVAIGLGIIFLGLTGAIAAQTVFHPLLETTVFKVGDVPLATVEQVREANKSQNLVFIDVRTPQEYDRDRIKGSFLVPIDAIEAGSGVEKVRTIAKEFPDSTLVLYCQRGPRSYRAYEHLKETGLDFVVLSGGITAWRKVVLAESNLQGEL